MITPTHDAIATQAYFTWEAEGRPHGRHERHWFAAEAALTRAAEPALVEAAPVEQAAAKASPAKKAAAPKKVAVPRKAAQPKAVAAPKPASPTAEALKAPAETVVAAAALAAPRAARSTAKGARRAH